MCVCNIRITKTKNYLASGIISKSQVHGKANHPSTNSAWATPTPAPFAACPVAPAGASSPATPRPRKTASANPSILWAGGWLVDVYRMIFGAGNKIFSKWQMVWSLLKSRGKLHIYTLWESLSEPLVDHHITATAQTLQRSANKEENRTRQSSKSYIYTYIYIHIYIYRYFYWK